MRTDVPASLVATHCFLYLTLHIFPAGPPWEVNVRCIISVGNLSNKETPVSRFRKPTFKVWGGHVPSLLPPEPESGILPQWVQNSSLSNTLKISLAFPVMKNVFHRFSEKLKRRLVWKLRLTHFASQLGLAIIATVVVRKLLPQGPIIKASIRQMSAVILGSVFTKFYLDLIPRKKTKNLSYLFTRTG